MFDFNSSDREGFTSFRESCELMRENVRLGLKSNITKKVLTSDTTRINKIGRLQTSVNEYTKGLDKQVMR